jgi:catalase
MKITESGPISQPSAAPLRGASSAWRLAAIAGVVVVTAGLFLYEGGWFTPRELTPAAIINTFEHEDRVHSGFRRNHPQGICVNGYFESHHVWPTV